MNRTAVRAVRAHLFAADVELGGAIDCGRGLPAFCFGFAFERRFAQRRLRARIFGLRHEIFVHAFASAFAPEARFAIAAEAARCVELIRSIDPHDAGLDLRSHIERETDVLGPYA